MSWTKQDQKIKIKKAEELGLESCRLTAQLQMVDLMAFAEYSRLAWNNSELQ